MANVFGILTAIVLALSAFIALKNKSHYDSTITDNKTQSATLVTSQARLTVAQKTLEDLPIEQAAVDTDIDKLTGAESAQQKINTALKAAADEKAAKIAANKVKLDAIREKTQGTSGSNIKELAAQMRAAKTEIEELTQSISAAEAKLANLTAQNTSSEAQVNEVKGKFENFTSGQSLGSLKTRIRSIYPNWGFVTLASGNNAGVVANSTLNVVRGGETVAKLLVTAVESSTSSASIIPDSLGQNVTLMVGDRVEPAAAKTAPAGAPTAAPAPAAASAPAVTPAAN
jgi:hypothetical protein